MHNLKPYTKFALWFTLVIMLTLMVIEGYARFSGDVSVPRYDRPAYLVSPGLFQPIRERPWNAEKPDNVVRIVFLGDSYTWGAGVPYNLTYVKHLEWMLNASSRRRYEVLNFGKSGATISDEARMLDQVKQIQPDFLIIGYFLDDPETSRDVPAVIMQVHEAINNPPKWRRWLLKHSYAYRRRWYKARSCDLRQAQVRYIRSLYEPQSRYQDNFAKALTAFVAFRQRVNIPVVFVLWPHLGFPLNETYPFRDIHIEIGSRLRNLGFPVLDLLEIFNRMDIRRLPTVPLYDPHPGEIAHRVAGDSLFEWLNKNYPDFARYLVTPRIYPNSPMQSIRLRMAPLMGRF